MTTKWKTEEVEKALQSVPEIELIGRNPQGSEITTTQLTYKVRGADDRLFVRGFSTASNVNLAADDTQVEMVELTSEYSDGGESDEPANVLARAAMTVALMKLGFSVVRSLDSYF